MRQTNWQQQLIDRGAAVSEGRITHFGKPKEELRATDTGTVICDLSHYALLGISGDDATEFLQGQLTNDVRLMKTELSQLSAYCDHKGRMLALFRLWPTRSGYHASLPKVLADETVKRLRMFVLRSKVDLRDVGEEVIRIGVAGPDAPALLERHCGATPKSENEFVDSATLRITRLPGVHPRFELHVAIDAATAVWEALAATATPVGAECWDLLTIRAAQPEIGAATRSLFTPQMLNLEVLNGVNFNKGCYTGQEVVARTQFLGTIKRRMFPGRTKTDAPPQPGSELVGTEAATGQATGRIVLSAHSPTGGFELLAMVQISAREQGQLHIGSADGPVIELYDPPYSLEQVKPGSR